MMEKVEERKLQYYHILNVNAISLPIWLYPADQAEAK